MALDKDILGKDLYNRANAFNETFIEPANIEAQRLLYWQNIADGIITHFKTNGVFNVPGAGLVAPNGPVSGISITGTIL